ncbi:MAG: LysR family transcriptional regulator [Gaiellaceae bacterium]
MGVDPGSWQGVEFRHLAALESIATEGSFSAAAAKTGYSQSAISGQIATLERLIGVRLVKRIRGSRKVTLTLEGERLVEHARAINARLSAARADIEQLEQNGVEGLRIGTFQSVSQTLLPDVVRGLKADGTPITLREDIDLDHHIEMLRSGALDAAFVLLPVDDDGIETIELLRDPWVLVVRTDHPLVWKQRPASADDISNLPLITFEQLPPQKLIEGSLRAAGAHVRVVTRMGDAASVLSMVSAGLGCGLVPRLSVDAAAGAARLSGLRFLPLDDQPPRLIGLAWNRERADDERIRRLIELAAGVARGESYRPARATHGRTA